MKKLRIILFSLLVLSLSYPGIAHAQDPDPVKDLDIPQMEKYVGTWEWRSGDNAFTIILKKEAVATDVTMLIGWIRFVKDGKVVVDKLNNTDKQKDGSLVGHAKKGDPVLHFLFSDEIKNQLRKGSLSFTGSNDSTALLTFGSEKQPGRPNPSRKSNPGAASFEQMKLKKIK